MKWIVYHFNPKVTRLEAAAICSFDINRCMVSSWSGLIAVAKIQEGTSPTLIDTQYDVKTVRLYAAENDCVYLKAEYKP